MKMDGSEEGYMEDDSVGWTEHESETKRYRVEATKGDGSVSVLEVEASDTIGVEALALMFGWDGQDSAEGYLDIIYEATQALGGVINREDGLPGQ